MPISFRRTTARPKSSVRWDSRYGGTTNGGYSTGTVYFDNVSVVKVTDELFMQEGEHVRLFIEPSQVYASAKQITEWLANLDKNVSVLC